MKNSFLALVPMDFRTAAVAIILCATPAIGAAAAPPVEEALDELLSYDHNGSTVNVDTDGGVITYARPKRSIADTIAVGAVLFQGHIGEPGNRKPINGTAYAFKKGCAPAPYPVTGAWTNKISFVLRGAGPVRKGCEVTGYSPSSPHAVLKFENIMAGEI
jgi:hypothetical protein